MTAAATTSPVDDATLSERADQLAGVIGILAPLVEADGGELHLVDADYGTGVVTVALSGACSACAVSAATLEHGIARILTQRLDWVTDVRHHVETSVDLATDIARGRGGFQPRAQ
jgi:Fe-S cluster biogenesis protein NfuA